MKLCNGAWALFGGDPNQDESIDAFDISVFMGQYGLTGDFLSCDFNGDGSVDVFDVQIIAANFGLTSAAPGFIAEPIGNKNKFPFILKTNTKKSQRNNTN